MNPATRKKSAENYAKSATAVIGVAKMLDVETIERLILCTEETAQVDGHQTHVSRDPDDVRGDPQHSETCPQLDGSGDCDCGAVNISDGTGRPTENQALAMMGRPVKDPLRDAALEALAMLTEVAGLMSMIRKRIHIVVNADAKLRGRTSTVSPCLRCGGFVTGIDPDRIKRGMGPRCYQAWITAGKPDGELFIRTPPESGTPKCGDVLEQVAS